MRKRTFTILLLLWAYVTATAQTIGLLQADSNNVDGYVLFSPIAYTSTYLIDKCGRKVNEWPGTYRPGNSVYLLEDGSLLRTGNMMNPNFGAGLRDLLFENITPENIQNIELSIKSGLEINFSNITIIELFIKPEPDNNTIVVKFSYIINNTGIEDEININFQNG